MQSELERILREHFVSFKQTDETEALFTTILTNLNEDMQQKIQAGATKEQALAESLTNIDELDDLLASIANRNEGKEFDSRQLNRFYDRFFATKLVQSIKCDVSQLNQIIIDYRSATIIVSDSPDDQLIINEYMNHDRPSLYAQKQQDGDKVKIEQKARGGAFAFMRIRVEILVPQKFTGFIFLNSHSGNVLISQLVGAYILEVSSTSGSILTHNLELTQIHLQAKSGSLKNGFLTAEQIVLNSASGSVSLQHGTGVSVAGMISVTAKSGNVELTHLTANEINAESHSGSLSSSQLHADKFNFLAKSGNINAEQLSGTGRFVSTSGNIHLDFKTVTTDLTLSSTSGSIHTTIPADSQCLINTYSSSGNTALPYATRIDPTHNRRQKIGQLGDQPTYTLNAHSNSGNIRIKITDQ